MSKKKKFKVGDKVTVGIIRHFEIYLNKSAVIESVNPEGVTYDYSILIDNGTNSPYQLNVDGWEIN